MFAYIHIPFCRRRCYYCDFPITVLGDSATFKISPWIEEYVNFLCEEILITKLNKGLEHRPSGVKKKHIPYFNPTTSGVGNSELRTPNSELMNPYSVNSELETIFFGGGTPSLLPINELARILDTLNQHFGIKKDAEISIEIDPGTFSLAQLKEYQKLGLNRFSLGVQAFQDHLLEVCGRSHSVKDVFAGINLIKEAQIDNFSIDLISGLPHQTIKNWEFSLKTAIKMQPKHISCYDLVLEPVTAFGKKYQSGDHPLPLDETSANMYRMASQILTEAGYNHYEISNYAKSGYECQHNQVYWHNQYYYGFGMGAASYTNNKRFNRPRNRQEYFAWVKKLSQSKGIIDTEKLTNIDILLETLMLGLRLAEGVNLAQIKLKFGEEIVNKIINSVLPYQEKNWVFIDEKKDYLRLTDPEGFLYSNVILSDLFNINFGVKSDK